jgi:hypothetical protein
MVVGPSIVLLPSSYYNAQKVKLLVLTPRGLLLAATLHHGTMVALLGLIKLGMWTSRYR